MSDRSTETPGSQDGDEKIRLGGMALGNGVLVHGPAAWACAIRSESGKIKVASGRKHLSGQGVKLPFLRGPARLIEALALIAEIHRELPEAKLPFQRPEVLATMFGSSVIMNALKRNENVSPLARELAVAMLAMAPAVVSLSGGESAAYHGAEHMTIGGYEHGHSRPKEHERCGSHLVGPLLAGQILAGILVSRVPKAFRAPAALAGSLAATGLATETFAWMNKNPERRLSKWLAKPGHELQERFGTREPSEEQLEVAAAALKACLALET